MIEEQLAKELKAAREKAGLTQNELAIKIGTKRNAIARLESGKHSTTLLQLIKIADALGYKLPSKLLIKKR